jgi:hypothetical protein
MTEDRGQRSEDRGRRAEDRRQKTRTEGRRNMVIHGISRRLSSAELCLF